MSWFQTGGKHHNAALVAIVILLFDSFQQNCKQHPWFLFGFTFNHQFLQLPFWHAVQTAIPDWCGELSGKMMLTEMFWIDQLQCRWFLWILCQGGPNTMIFEVGRDEKQLYIESLLLLLPWHKIGSDSNADFW
jgi:hypothetical protein